MPRKFNPSIHLSESENRRLNVLESCLYAAPLLDTTYAEYVKLCVKAHRKARSNW